MTLESLNQLNYQGANVKIVLNDNEMAISKMLVRYLNFLTISRSKKNITEKRKSFKSSFGKILPLEKNVENLLKKNLEMR